MSTESQVKLNISNAWTRGGQVSLHNLRMIRQVLWVTLLITFFCGFLFVGIKTWTDFGPYQRYVIASSYMADALTFLPSDKTRVQQSFKDESGRRKWVKSVSIQKSGWIQKWRKEFEKRLYENFLLSLWIMAGILLIICYFWIYKGKAIKEKEILSGIIEVPQKQLVSLLKKRKEASDIELDGIPLVKDSETKHILLVGTTGAGKTNTFNTLLPQIRNKNQKAIIVDTTGVFVEKYYDPKTDIILNPLDARSHPWDIWKECPNDLQAEDLAASLVPQGMHDPFWSEAARSLFVETFKKLKRESNPSLKTLLDYAVNKPLAKIQDFYANTPAAALVDISADKTAASIRVNLAAYIRSLFLLEDVPNAFSIREWIQDDQQKGWLFLLALPEQRETLRPLLTTWLNISINSLMSSGINPDRRVWFIIDEKPSLNKVESLPKALAEIRKYGGCIVSGLQNISQIDKLYGHDIRKTMSSLYNTKIFFRSPDSDTAKWIVKTIGENEVIENTEGISYGAHQMRDGVSINEQRKFKAVIPYTELMSLPDLTAYIKLPEDYPITKISFSYKDILNKNMAFVPKVEKA